MKIIFSPFFGNHVFIDLDKKGETYNSNSNGENT